MRHEKLADATFESIVRQRATDHSLRLIIPANERAVRRGLSGIKAGLSSINLVDDDWSTIEIVLAEVLNNIVEHAYSDGEVGLIETQLDFDGKYLWCTTIDSGRPMPNGKLPEGAQKDLNCNLEDLPEGGFGWYLIHKLTEDLHYGRDQGRNMVTFRLNIQRRQ
ncbi:serine/threonine-protein kinase RsbW [Pacificibacter maritimus]|uniref:Serine/threonine-protein kinase RsbW n=1 Tax=Pacificibacter maritimus TaxID=762213 RepID=A0A3N4U2Y7_9RHOB|nr:ATP-binding protein [Pacificibacter maritimus]RPE64862.1 serine/threonine-protein kinase RsbW [Pacificibacter maritimus]